MFSYFQDLKTNLRISEEYQVIHMKRMSKNIELIPLNSLRRECISNYIAYLFILKLYERLYGMSLALFLLSW